MIDVPARFTPRWYQEEVFLARDRGINKFFLRWHRRCGKDLCGIAFMAREAMRKVGIYWYIFPTSTQARKAMWTNMDKDGVKLMDRIPHEIRTKTLDGTMTIELKNGSLIQLIGADKHSIDGSVGAGPSGIIMSEFAVGEDYAIVKDLITPMLHETGGWLMVNSTPRGRNHMYKLEENIRMYPDEWFISALQTISPEYGTGRYTGLVTPKELESMAQSGMAQDTLFQEYGVSYNAGVTGTIFEDQVQRAREAKRVRLIEINDTRWVETFWDLGVNDSTVIWFGYRLGDEILFIDYFEDRGQDLAYYVGVLQNKGYRYRYHHLPHDGSHRSIQTKYTTKQMLQLCIKEAGIGGQVRLARKTPSKQQNITSTRGRFGSYHFDAGRCYDGLQHLELYHRKYDKVRKVSTNEPVHDEHSHAADALMVEAMSKSSAAYTMTGDVIRTSSLEDPDSYDIFNTKF